MSYTDADIIICGGQHKGYLKAINKKTNLMDQLKINNEQKTLKNAKIIIAHSMLMKKELIELYNIQNIK